MSFKVGDKIKLKPHWNDGCVSPQKLAQVFEIQRVIKNFEFKDEKITKYVFNGRDWAEEHEITLYSKLYKALL